MENILDEKAQDPISHGFFLGNGTFVTPAKMKMMESFGILGEQKPNSKNG